MSNLFRFEVFVSSKQLGDALALLSGRVAQITPPQLVANAKAGRGGNGISNMSADRLVEMFGEHIRSKRVSEIDSKFTQAYLESIGRSPQSASYLQKKASAAGLIKNVGSSPADSRWKVMGMRAAAASKRKPTKSSKPKRKKATPAAAAKAE